VRKLAIAGLVGLALLELANVYFIMPMPYSQRRHTIDLAYALHGWRWGWRIAIAALLMVALPSLWRQAGWRRWTVVALAVVVAAVTYEANFVLAADAMFLPPTALVMAPGSRNAVAGDRLIVGIVVEGEARAYPIQFIGYHHQVRDTAGSTPLLVTFCTVCRTGRIFSPIVDGQVERFRLVGMDRFNAMFEDATTGSWWRQATGEAIAGPRKGQRLTALHSEQMTLANWLALHPDTLIMQGDPRFKDQYPNDAKYETGESRSTLTGTDRASWADKSWIVGVDFGDAARAYDWNRLRRERIVNDIVGGRPIVIVLAPDDVSFVAFERPDRETTFSLDGDRVVGGGHRYDFAGRGEGAELRRIFVSQEFWHSWRSFHPHTDQY
jgi:hypothetical protein